MCETVRLPRKDLGDWKKTDRREEKRKADWPLLLPM